MSKVVGDTARAGLILAPGLTGIYQVSVRIPLRCGGARLRLSCETTNGYP
jgi:hypothetical protein